MLKISIITVCYNSESTIAECLQSVATQCWPDIEHIVIDGASTDNTKAVITENSHSNMQCISEADNGIYDAMNKGLTMATGDYVAFLNSDDLYSRTDAVRLVACKAADTNADCIMGNVQFFTKNKDNPTGRHYSVNNFSKWWITLGIMPPHPGLFVRRDLMISAGGFDESYRISADFDLVARLLLRHKANWAVLGETITLFRSGGVSTAGNSVRAELTNEFARSLGDLSVSWPKLRVLLRFPLKALQYLPTKLSS